MTIMTLGMLILAASYLLAIVGCWLTMDPDTFYFGVWSALGSAAGVALIGAGMML
ncbi:hypothetical protein [Amaricoccus solimangrovi]|uniref:hypothetical protein n=1 Tax=Amaricoccus solimangrovi TaxID=2589815 RepID=UPI0015E38A7E|nr:hypothetical protein [Amaricoccus solimangrovi]